MPTKSKWVPPELFLEHKGIEIFHAYKDNDVEKLVAKLREQGWTKERFAQEMERMLKS